MGPNCKIVDTFPDFLEYWEKASSLSLDKQIQLWRSQYMQKYRELLEKQLQCYRNADVDWKEIARKIFPKFKFRISLMRTARKNILAVYHSIWKRALHRLGVDFDTIFVIYVGLGCGAGWATTYNGKPSVLLGLENIAEEKWHTKAKLKGLISHEIGHLTHMKWREEWETFEKNEEDPLFLLYSEGFAQRCEHLILERESWHMAPNREWLLWCRQNRKFLAKEFLTRLKEQRSVNDFFGSWFDIQGKSQTGYFLGYIFIQELEKIYSLREISLLEIEEIKKLALQFLESEAHV